MSEFVTIKNKNPRIDGKSLVLARRDFVAGVHELYEAPKAKAEETNGKTAVDPKSIVDLNATDAKALVESTVEVPALQAMLDAEKAHAKYEGGRKSVVDAIEAKLNPKA